VAERTEPFDVELRGLGEFVSAHRVVAWLGVGNGAERLRELRAEICSLDRDSLPHSFHPHCTLAYGDDPVAYAGFREVLRREVGKVRVRLQVDSIWVAGFRSGTHPARALGYRVELPFGAVAGTGTAPAAS
jgi:2'-5' RNA ligase